jgi:hypothetical protein
MTGRRRLLLLAAGACLLPAAQASAQSTSGTTAAPAPARVPARPVPPPRVLACPQVAPTTPPSSGLLGALGVLRAPAGPEDALPADALRQLKARGLAPADPASARLLRTTPDGGRAWIVPVPDVSAARVVPCRARRGPQEGVAVVATGGAPAGGGAALGDLVRGRGAVAVDVCAGPRHDMLAVSGVVPDGVAAAYLTSPDGTAVRADVADNGYAFVVAHARRTGQRYVVWTGGDGTPHVQPVPPAFAPRRAPCGDASRRAVRVTPEPYVCPATVVADPVRPSRRPVRRAVPVPLVVPCAVAPPPPAPMPVPTRPVRPPVPARPVPGTPVPAPAPMP